MAFISKEICEDFQKNGVVCLRNFLAPKWIALLKEGFLENINSPGPFACYYTNNNTPELLRNVNLKPGSPLNHELFPLVWQKNR